MASSFRGHSPRYAESVRRLSEAAAVAGSSAAAYRQSMVHVAAGLSHVLHRQELRALIASALKGGSVLLIADAGFGKTTALRDVLDQTRRQAAWVRCGDAGGDAGRL